MNLLRIYIILFYQYTIVIHTSIYILKMQSDQKKKLQNEEKIIWVLITQITKIFRDERVTDFGPRSLVII